MLKRLLGSLFVLALLVAPAIAAYDFPASPTTGQTYSFDGHTWVFGANGAWSEIASGNPAITKQVFTASGTYTPSSGMQYAIIECVGAGGGGGGASGAVGYELAGSGGGGGAYSRAYVTAAQVGASQAVTVSSTGGSGGSGAAAGSAGGDSSVGSLCVAKGGSGGGYVSNAVINGDGAGGAASGGTGDVKIDGGYGHSYWFSLGTSNADPRPFTIGGSSFFGGAKSVILATGTLTNGSTGSTYGGGGTGGFTYGTTGGSSATGGTGGGGIVVITEYLATSWGGPLPQVVNPQGRLTLTSATPVTTSDVTAATTVYYTPYKGSYAPLYNGTQFTPVYFNELSLVLGANWATNSNYDVFLANNAGAIDICTGPAWTSDTARGTGAGTTELEQKQGIYVNKNSLTCRTDNATTITVAVDQGTYLGTFRTVAAGQTEDSLVKRFVWNMYNRVNRPLKVVDATATWTYSTASMRQANGNTANQAAIVRGLDEEAVTLSLTAEASTSAATARETFNSIGLDSTTVDVPGCMTDRWVTSSTGPAGGSCTYSGLPGLGYHFLAWLEYAGGADVQTWYGTSGNLKSGMLGSTPQ